MLRKIALWLLDLLRVRLDPELQKQIEDYKEQARAQADQLATVQQQVRRLQREYSAASAERQQLQRDLSALEIEIGALDRRIKETRDEKTDLRDVSDHDILRRDF